jgi:hypothetical protein
MARGTRGAASRAGDFLLAPLGEGQHAFGRVLETNKLRSLGVLVTMYSGAETTVPPLADIKARPRQPSLFYMDPGTWRDAKWRIVGHLPIEPGEFPTPRFKEGLDGVGWFIREGESVTPASADEVRGLEYLSIRPPRAVTSELRREMGLSALQNGSAPAAQPARNPFLTQVRHYVYFRSQEDASAAAEGLRKAGLVVEVGQVEREDEAGPVTGARPDESDDARPFWLRGTDVIERTHEALDHSVATIVAIVEPHRGEYDGHESAV